MNRGAYRSAMPDRRGVAAVEFAIIAPVLITLLAAAANIGLAVDHTIRLANAGRAAAQYLTYQQSDSAGALAAAQAILPGVTFPPAQSGSNPKSYCTCPTSGSTGGNAVDCTTDCPTGMARYVQVTVRLNPPQIAALAFASTAANQRTVVARVQ